MVKERDPAICPLLAEIDTLPGPRAARNPSAVTLAMPESDEVHVSEGNETRFP